MQSQASRLPLHNTTPKHQNQLPSLKRKELNYDDQLLLKRFLLTIAKGEKTVEKQRQQLAKLKNFEPHSVFQRIDRDGDKKISSLEILNFLRSNNVDEATEADTAQIIDYFSASTTAEHLQYQDLLQIIMPCDDGDLRAELCQRSLTICQTQQVLDPDVELALTNLFEKEIAFNRVMEDLKQRIACSKTFDLELAFNQIDDWKYGFIDRKNLKSFFRKHSHIASNHECISIIRRMDLDADSRLTLQEFTDGFTPNDPYSKTMKRIEINKQVKHGAGHIMVYQDGNGAAKYDDFKVIALDRQLSKKRNNSSSQRAVTPLKMRPLILKDVQMFASGRSNQASRLAKRRSLSERKSSHKSLKRCVSLSKSYERLVAKAKLRSKSKKKFDGLKKRKKSKQLQQKKIRQMLIHQFGKENKKILQQENLKSNDQWQGIDDFIQLTTQKGTRRRSRSKIIIEPRYSSAEKSARSTRSNKPKKHKVKKTLNKKQSNKLLALTEETFFIDCLVDLTGHEKSIELLKINIAMQPDFNLIDAFSMIDKDCRSEVTSCELQKSLHELNLQVNDDQLKLLFARYADSAHSFTYSNFTDAFLPCDEYYCRALIGKRLSQNETGQTEFSFQSDTLQMYLSLWAQILHVEIMVESIRRKLIARPNFGLVQAFNSLDHDFDGQITVQDVSSSKLINFQICKLFDEHEIVKTTSQDIELLVRRLGKGSRDGRIKFEFFRNSLTPVLHQYKQ